VIDLLGFRRARGLLRRRPALRQPLLVTLVALGDALVVFDAFAVAYLLRFHWQVALWHADPAPLGEYLKALAVVAYSWLILFKVFGLYDFSRARSVLDTVQSIVKAVSFGTLLILSLTFFYRQFTFSRLVCGYAWGLSILLFGGFRVAIEAGRARGRRSGAGLVETAVVGSRTLARFLIEKLQAEPELGYRVAGVVDQTAPQEGLQAPFLGPVDELDSLIEKHGLRAILIAHPNLGHLELLQVIEVCEQRGVTLRMVPPTYDLQVNYRDFEEVDGIPLVRINEQECRRLGDLVKRAFDLTVAGAALVLSGPLLLLSAAAIRAEDGGPALFIQKRMGKDGRLFSMFKLRTMVVEAESLLPSLVDVGTLGEPVFKLENDPRVTRVGRFLRRSSLDELPQLLNVLRGEMSLVGPRPEEEGLVRRYDVWERRRLKAAPGITGLQQVQCRGSRSLKERVRWDILYLRKRSLLLDLWILLKTCWVVVSGKGAR
jgi:exopolysaccharide biosynthesis polyprenyl glycosylphosphotransferase